jgi:hypothetical protein
MDEMDLEFFTPEAEPAADNSTIASRQNNHDSYLGSNQFSLLSSDFCHCESQKVDELRLRALWISQTHTEDVDEEEDIRLPSLRTESRSIRQWAYFAAAGLDPDCDSWDAFGGLACVKGIEQEQEL